MNQHSEIYIVKKQKAQWQCEAKTQENHKQDHDRSDHKTLTDTDLLTDSNLGESRHLV